MESERIQRSTELSTTVYLIINMHTSLSVYRGIKAGHLEFLLLFINAEVSIAVLLQCELPLYWFFILQTKLQILKPLADIYVHVMSSPSRECIHVQH